MYAKSIVILFFFLGTIVMYAQDLEKMSLLELDSAMNASYGAGQLSQAVLYAEETANRQRGNDTAYVKALDNLAAICFGLGKYEKAEQLYWELTKLRKKITPISETDYANTMNNLASVYYATGKYEEAEPLFLEATALWKKILGETHPQYANSLHNLASLYAVLKKNKQAEELFLKANPIWKASLGEQHQQYANLLNNLADLYTKMKKYELAEPLFLQASSIFKTTLGENNPYYAISLNNLATLYYNMGKYDLAKSYCLQTTELWQKYNLSNNLYNIIVLNNLANSSRGLHQYEDAIDYTKQSILANCKDKNIDSTQLGKDLTFLVEQEFFSSSQILNTLDIIQATNKALYDSLGSSQHLEYAYKSIQVAMQINEKIRNSMKGQEDKLRILENMAGFVQNALKIGDILANNNKNKKNYIEDGFKYAEQNKSVLLADAIKGNRARALGDMPDSLVLYEIKLQEKKKQLEQAEIEAKEDIVRQAIYKQQNELNLEIEDFLATIKNQYPKYHKIKYGNFIAKTEEIQQLLDEKSLLIEYFISDSVTYLFAVTKQDIQLFPIKISLTELQTQIKTLRHALSNYNMIVKKEDKAYELYTSTAFWFYNKLVKIALENKKIDNLIIVTDGEFGHLPFEAFLVEQPESIGSENQAKINYSDLHYLVNDYNISYNYSATLWKENLETKQQGNNHKMLACGATYSTVDSTLLNYRKPEVFELRNLLNPLPAAQTEIAALEELFQGDFLLGNEANEHFFKKHAADYGVIHLAMHGILHPRIPALSSLAFTENLDSLDDNFLQAYEISRLKLQADLIVLSACETGYGEFEQGEGVVSLARAFMYAGTPSLVVSLWQVNDQSTATIMQSFYMYLSEGFTKDAALRQAKLDYIKNAKGIIGHPAFWSPFIQLGDSRAIQIKLKQNRVQWFLGGIVVLSFLIIGFLKFQKRRSEV